MYKIFYLNLYNFIEILKYIRKIDNVNVQK